MHVSINGSNLLDFEYVWIHSLWTTRDIAHAIQLLLDKLNIPHNTVEQDHSKLSDYVALAINNISIPTTVFMRNQRLIKSYAEVVSRIGSPFVLKACRSTWGKGVYLITDESYFKKVVARLSKSRAYVCQRYIPNTFDYRATISFGKVASCVKRIRKPGVNEFRNNSHLGAKEVFINPSELPAEVARLAIETANALKLDWCGVDIVPDLPEKNFYILEANRNPGTTSGSPEVPAALEHLWKLRTVLEKRQS